MGLTRRQLLDIDNALADVENFPGEPLFVLAVAQLRTRLEPHVYAIREHGRLPDALAKQYMDYDSRRIELCREWALTDANGQPVRDEAGQFVLRSTTDFEVALREVQQSNEYRAAYEAVERQKAEWIAWASQEATELGPEPLPTLPFDKLPRQVTPRLLKPLLPLLAGLPETTPVEA